MLPPLPFGHAVSKLEGDFDQATELLAQLIPSLKLTPLSKAKHYQSRGAAFEIGHNRLLSSASTPTKTEVEESRGWHFIFPFIGRACLHCDGAHYDLQPRLDGVLLPNMRRTIEWNQGSQVLADIDANRLQSTQTAMIGSENEPSVLPEQPIALSTGLSSGLFPSLLLIGELLVASTKQEGLSDALGVDDLFYRWLASASLARREEKTATLRTGQSLDLVCDMVRSAYDRPLTLTEMERASGMSARALQYAFKARFNCSPMEWQRKERMHEAQKRLINLLPDETITSIAHAMGFSSSAAFATLYKRYFNEMPSETIRRLR